MKVRNYADVVTRLLTALEKSNHLTVWHRMSTQSYPLYCLHYAAEHTDTALIYVSAGIHGDEPAGVECAIRLIELLADKQQCNLYPFPLDEYNWLISPCDNPYGYEHDLRENDEGFDLNRMFEAPIQYAETTFISESLLRTQEHNNTKVQLALDLHEDRDSDGFYLWERRASMTLPIGDEVIQQVRQECPINQRYMIEDHCNDNGVITLLDSVTTKGWTRGRYLAEQIKTRCLILETPTTLNMDARVKTHMLSIQTAVKHGLKEYAGLANKSIPTYPNTKLT